MTLTTNTITLTYNSSSRQVTVRAAYAVTSTLSISYVMNSADSSGSIIQGTYTLSSGSTTGSFLPGTSSGVSIMSFSATVSPSSDSTYRYVVTTSVL